MAPNTTYLEFNYVKETPTGRGINTRFIMENLGTGEFRCTEGNVGIRAGRHKPKIYERPMEEWEDTFDRLSRKGFLLTKTEKMEKKKIQTGGMSLNGENFAPLLDQEVAAFVNLLTSYANQLMEESYTVSVEMISNEMISLAEDILNTLATGYETMSVADFNNKLKILYAAIPRRIDNLSKVIAHMPSDMRDIVAKEQELFDVMVSQIRSAGIASNSTGRTILDAFGIDINRVTDSEEAYIKRRMGQQADRYRRAFRVRNLRTEANFDAYCKKEQLAENAGIDHLFHGSRSENFWSIITNGLTINPVGVVITGKAYGNGTYFAPNAIKSMGYTSSSGSKWANGTEKVGYLGIYKVATGKRYSPHGCDTSLTWKKLQEKCPGAHCTWAEARYSGFMMDEVIVYQDCQSTVEYLVEFS